MTLFPDLKSLVTSIKLRFESLLVPIILNDATIGSTVEALSVREILSFSLANCDNTYTRSNMVFSSRFSK